MLPSGMFEDSTLAAGSIGFNPIATLPMCQLTCQHSPLLGCSLSWETVVMPELQVDPPGRALSTPFFVPRRGNRGGERSGEKRWEEEEDRLSPAVGSFTHPSLPPSSSPFGFLLFFFSFFFEHVCCSMNVHEGTHYHTCKHTNTHSESHPVSVLSLSLTGEQRPAVSDGGDLPVRVPCWPGDTSQADCV